MGRIAEVTGAAAMVVALTATVSAQAGSNFLSNIDPLFAGVLARPGNLDNTIQYAASAAAHGDIESAISAYDRDAGGRHRHPRRHRHFQSGPKRTAGGQS